MRDGCVLAIDQGSRSSRAMVFDARGRVVAAHREPVSMRRRSGGRVEQDAGEILDSVLRSVSACLALVEGRDAIGACGLATQRSSVLACDGSGRAVSAVLSWQDTRGAGWLARLRRREAAIRRISGLPLSPHYGASKLRWLARRDGDAVLAPLAAWLLKNLIVGSDWRVDSANAQRTQLFDVKALDWSERLLRWFELRRERLPVCRPVLFDFGELLDTGIPVTAVSGDQNAAVFGNGVLAGDAALLNLGSGAFVLAEKPAAGGCGDLLTSVGVTASDWAQWLCEGTVNGAGSALAWASWRWPVDDLEAVLREVENPPVFINTVGGVGSPWWISGVEPFIAGGDDAGNGARMVAVVESVVFLLMDNLALLRARTAVRRIVVSGGLANLDGLCRKLASLAELPVERRQNTEATARGIAWLAAGCPADWEMPPERRFEPLEDAGLRARYAVFRERLGALRG